ncbi:uncharacterized protein EI90DRAFT_3045948 [Cantharellus anzutake]|uniref:uncharacterized protein n=1 Tax=Cantharellus anzutake TaxID=1750568 RepID=UPI001905D539|nr:uncharacterized protein EI90DRAFT_3045948 [Cantharellus anzutake]KAF8336489.1 hypothetical protein EI90DRAFT_3045948 [Cantharellus anzutake]
MVEEGLRDCIDDSSWKPSIEEVDAFVSACRGLPIIASIRVRDVCLQTHRGATLQSEFEYFRDLIDAPVDVNLEYLRVLRRAYMVGSSGVRKHIAEKYRQVVATINAAFEPLSVFFISQLSGITEGEVLAILEPIRSIVDLSSKSDLERFSENPPESPSGEMQGVKFYHATMKEFITGDWISSENDQVFFIRDANKYFIGLPLLRFFNNSCEWDVFGDPTSSPLRHERSRVVREDKKHHRPHHLRYARQYLLEHLDPSQLFAQGSNLQNEFNTFLTRHLVTFMHLAPINEHRQVFPDGFDEFKHCDSFKLLREAREKQFVEYLDVVSLSPWHLHRSTLPFTPSSSPLYKLYGHLTDPVRIFTISGEFSGHRIPLSEDLLDARMVMEAKLPDSEKVDRWGSSPKINYEVQFNDPDIRNGIVTCAALSLNGHHIALGIGSGIIELADIDHQCTISQFQLDRPNHPVWVEFVHGSHRVAAEDNEGNVTILSHNMASVNLGTLPNNQLPAVTRVSDNGLFIIRVPWNTDNSWYDNMTLISILDNPHMQLLASPPSQADDSPRLNTVAIPHRRTLGFSPGARYIGAFDGLNAFTWSTDSGELIAHYRVTDFKYWIMNPAVSPACSYRLPDPVSTRPTLSLAKTGTADIHHSEPDAGHNLDESWIKCPFYLLSQTKKEEEEGMLHKSDIRSSAAGRTPLFGSGEQRAGLPVFFNGKLELVIPEEYRPVVSSSANGLGAWYGDQVPFDPTHLYSPRSSKDGTRILLQGWQTAPIVVDLSQVI